MEEENRRGKFQEQIIQLEQNFNRRDGEVLGHGWVEVVERVGG